MSKIGIWKKPEGKKLTTDKCQKVSFLIYPDSVAEGWLDYLRSSNLKCAVSPLHSQDINDDGSLQKPHYHLVILYSQSVPWTTWEEIRANINAYQHFEKLRSSQDMINYLTHDSYTAQDKFKYSKDDIIWINCCEADFIEDEHIRVINFIEDNRIMSFRSLINSLLDDKGYEGQLLVKWITKNVLFTNTYLRSFQSRKKD